MPFFYQQVQVSSTATDGSPPAQPVTYYDGGVRQSMFVVDTITALSELAGQRRAAARLANPSEAMVGSDQRLSSPVVYMVRNGPTIALPDDKANNKRDAITSALRGYSLIVNQSEVMAIETIRLRYPEAEMRLITADGYDKAYPGSAGAICEKNDPEAMFEPQFMQCLQRYGAYLASRPVASPDERWIVLTKRPEESGGDSCTDKQGCDR
jgi:hypothetical protein